MQLAKKKELALSHKVGKAFRKLRRANGKNGSKMASLLGVNAGNLCWIEAGKISASEAILRKMESL
jgi:transcriptional regulator with XRE-family HTH domain